MKVAIGTDHGGFALKATVLEAVRAAGHEPLDFGAFDAGVVDYPDYAEKVGQAIQNGQAARGILLCGSGIGACIAANKLKGVYAGIAHDIYSAHQGVEHDDMNVLCMGARVLGPGPAREIVTAFLGAHYAGEDPGGEHHARRVGKVRMLENDL